MSDRDRLDFNFDKKVIYKVFSKLKSKLLLELAPRSFALRVEAGKEKPVLAGGASNNRKDSEVLLNSELTKSQKKKA